MDVTAQYAQHLTRKGMRLTSVKNYVSDARQFMLWKERYNINADISLELVDIYLKTSSFTKSPYTTKRRLLSLNIFYNWLINNDKPTNSPATTWSKAFVYVTAFTGVLLLTFTATSIATHNIGVDEPSYTFDRNRIPNLVNYSVPESIGYKQSSPIEIAVSGYEIESPLVTTEPEVMLELQNKIALKEEESVLDKALAPQAGREMIEQGNNYSVILNNEITEDSIIIVSPTAPVSGTSLYIHDQGKGFALVAIEKLAKNDIPFNWLLVQ